MHFEKIKMSCAFIDIEFVVAVQVPHYIALRASQEERVLILNMVLLRKGVRLPDAPRSNNEQNHEQNAESANRSIISDASPAPTASGITEDTDEGVYL